ncbi:hypothetical protein T484DRAFT_1814961, partial [Baffinella frigidus]
DEIALLKETLVDPEKRERERVGAIKAFCEGDTFMTFAIVHSLLSETLNETDHPTERVELVRQCFNRLLDSERAPDLLLLLNTSERIQVVKYLGMVATSFTKSNTTGHYRLELSKKPQRDICLRLCEVQNAQTELTNSIDAYYSDRMGGLRPVTERTWRNATLDNKPHTFSYDWIVPQYGFLELDFVQLKKPSH